MTRPRLHAIPTPRGRQLLRALFSFGVQPIATERKSSTPVVPAPAEVATTKHPLRPPHFPLRGTPTAAAPTVRRAVEAV